MEKRLLTLIALFAAAAFFALRVEVSKEGKGGVSVPPRLPVRAGVWTGRRIPPTQEELDILGADSVEQVEYRNPSGNRVVLCVVRERRERESFHPPEYCYLAQSNVSMEGKGRAFISLDCETIEASTLVLKRKGAALLVLYWYRAGDYRTPSYYKHQLSFVWRLFRSGGSDSVMVRLSTPLGDGGVERGVKNIESLLADLYPDYPAF